MTQRKLTGEERSRVAEARLHIRQVLSIVGITRDQHLYGVHSLLTEMQANNTTDGLPYVEPTPEIGEGYRPATTADEDRIDREAFAVRNGMWVIAKVGFTIVGATYRVPVDRIPTDEDAKQRPAVMVRDNKKCSWQMARLLGVVPGGIYPFACDLAGVATTFAEARFPYPGELDQ